MLTYAVSIELKLAPDYSALLIEGWGVSEIELYEIGISLDELNINLPIVQPRLDVYEIYKNDRNIKFRNKFFSGFSKNLQVKINSLESMGSIKLHFLDANKNFLEINSIKEHSKKN